MGQQPGSFQYKLHLFIHAFGNNLCTLSVGLEDALPKYGCRGRINKLGSCHINGEGYSGADLLFEILLKKR